MSEPDEVDAPLEVRVSVPDAEVGQRLADLLVAERLAACVQVLGEMTSTYLWQGRVERDTERLLLAKTTIGRFEALCARVEAEHPYDTPEILAVTVEAGSSPYVRWLADSVRP